MKKPMIKQIAHVCILARDLEETADWYHRVLGIQKVFNFLNEEGEVVGFYLNVGGRSHLEVFQNKSAAPKPHNVIWHICLEVAALDEVIAHVRGCEVKISDKILGADDTWQSWLTDPSGVEIELFEYTDKSAQFVGRDRVV